MVAYAAAELFDIVDGHILQRADQDFPIENLITDSRQFFFPIKSLFFALPGQSRDGHSFLTDLYKHGVRNFVVQEDKTLPELPGANIIAVASVIDALQKIAAYHRRQYQYPVIGISGSNGKTIVKEWLAQLLHTEYNIVRSPKSYNSQIGVPLS
ncbi:MAG: Mur ligase domain-containing protein, partial [Saprospiraceae bacterium]